MDNLTILSDIETKIRKMKARNERLEKENEELRKSLFEYLQKMELQKKDSEKAKMHLQALQVGKSTDMNTAQLRKELDHYIYMIDKCIASINVK
jgi:replicative DNA helicase